MDGHRAATARDPLTESGLSAGSPSPTASDQDRSGLLRAPAARRSKRTGPRGWLRSALLLPLQAVLVDAASAPAPRTAHTGHAPGRHGSPNSDGVACAAGVEGSWLARVAHEVAAPPVALVAIAILVLVHLRAVGGAREPLAAVRALDYILETRRGPSRRPATSPGDHTG